MVDLMESRKVDGKTASGMEMDRMVDSVDGRKFKVTTLCCVKCMGLAM